MLQFNADLTPGAHYTWTARVRGTPEQAATAYVRQQTFAVCAPASFKESDSSPSAVEYLLGAVGGELVTGFAAYAARRGLAIEALEVSVTGQLANPLVLLGVVGESGRPRLEQMAATLYVNSEADADSLQEAWQETLARSPLVNTLQTCVTLSLTMQKAD